MKFIADPLLALPRAWKRTIAIGVDVALCALTVWVAYYIRLGVFVPMNGRPMLAIALSAALATPVFAAFGLYRIVFRHAGAHAVASCAAACVVYGLGYSAIVTAYGFERVPRTIGLLQPVLLFIAVAASRSVAGMVLGRRYERILAKRPQSRALIYGAGGTGRQLAEAMAISKEMRIVGFLDDDGSLHNSSIRHLRVYAPDTLDALVEKLGVTDVLLAIPTARRARRAEIVDRLNALGLRVRTLPGLLDLAHGTFQTSDLRDVTITDLLQRDPVEHDDTALHEHITGGVILVTGAGGSIGSELCRQIAAMKPRQLLLVERTEFALYAIHDELQALGYDMLVPLLASVTDRVRMDRILATWKPQIVFHAAAYKHVPLVEHNPLEGLRNNVLGTAIVAELSAHHGVRDFVLISTDKAVRPTNVMGASKRLAELVLQGLSESAAARQTCFSMVRFGNVLGSSGSVVPLFTRQIESGGPITITHPDITRYFMTIPEAVQLVLQAGAMATGGEVFVLDMGKPVRIYDLALNMIRLSGLTPRDVTRPDGDIEIRFIGLRPGEKLFEELLIGNSPMATPHPRIMKATEHSLAWDFLRLELDRLTKMIETSDVHGARALLQELVVEFGPTTDIVDWVTMVGAPAPASATIMTTASR